MEFASIVSRAKTSVRYRSKSILNIPEKQLYALGFRSTELLSLPDFLIIGTLKAGTTWLKRNLDHHPELYLPGVISSEVRYFDQEFYKPLSYYASLYQSAGDRIKGEKSPYYCTLPARRIRFIKKIMPDVRLIFMVRNPIERAWSYAMMKLKDSDLGEIEVSKYHQIFRKSRAQGDYLTILDNWLSVFPSDQLHLGFFERIFESPKSMLSDIFDFLGVTDSVDWSSLPYNQVINQGRRSPIPEKLRKFLEEMYCQDIEALHERLGEPVSLWRC